MILTTILAAIILVPTTRYLLLTTQLYRAALISQYAYPKTHIVCKEFKKRFWWQGQLFFSILSQPKSVWELMCTDEIYTEYYSVKPNAFFPTIKIK